MRLIDADKLKAVFAVPCYEAFGVTAICSIIDDAPTVDAVQARHGKWILIEDMYDDHWQCSACGIEWTFIDGTAMENGAYYCPNCGAKMAGE